MIFFVRNRKGSELTSLLRGLTIATLVVVVCHSSLSRKGELGLVLEVMLLVAREVVGDVVSLLVSLGYE